MSISDENKPISKAVAKYIIEKIRNNKNLRLCYEKDGEKYSCGYLDMTIKSTYKPIVGWNNYYKFDMTINNIESVNKDFELSCCLSGKDLKKFDIGKHIYGLCYYDYKNNSFRTAHGILFDNFATNIYEDSYYDLIDLNSNIFRVAHNSKYDRVMSTNFYTTNLEEF